VLVVVEQFTLDTHNLLELLVELVVVEMVLDQLLKLLMLLLILVAVVVVDVRILVMRGMLVVMEHLDLLLLHTQQHKED